MTWNWYSRRLVWDLDRGVGDDRGRCRIRTIMSNRGPLTCGVLAGEQRDLAGVPDVHEQSGALVMSAGAHLSVIGVASTTLPATGSHPLASAAAAAGAHGWPI